MKKITKTEKKIENVKNANNAQKFNLNFIFYYQIFLTFVTSIAMHKIAWVRWGTTIKNNNKIKFTYSEKVNK